MIQKRFLCKDMETAKSAVSQLDAFMAETAHKSAVLTIYEAGFSKDEVASLIGSIKACGRPELMIAGITATLIAELMPEGTGALLNLIMTREADIDVIPVHCVPGGEYEAAQKLNSRLDEMDHVRAVELFGSNMALNTTRFMENAMKGYEDVVMFGTSTIRNLPQKLSVEQSEKLIDIERVDEDSAGDEFIIGNDVLLDGFVAVVFSGEDLKVEADYALGWNPIGRRLPLKLGTNPSRGETVIDEINGKPAVDIYREYLGVYPDSYLISNICEFPFIVERDGINICLIPIDCGKDGELYFMMTLCEEEQLRFSFASHDEVLYASRRSLERMENFRPEALFLTLCGNRINYLKEDAHIEWDEFKSIAPDYALMHGACELLYYKGKGGILNSAHLAIGLKEGEGTKNADVKPHPDLDSLRRGRTMSLSDRMSVFLKKITTELIERAAEARDANNAKSAFLSHISHEIRTPINVILGMDEMILQEGQEKEVLNYAEGIKSAGNNLLGLVNDILDFSRIEAGKMSIIPVEYDLLSVVNDLYNVVRLRAEDKGLVIRIDVDPKLPTVLLGDEMRIKQIVSNILTNAVKYTEKGSITFKLEKISYGGEEYSDELLKACPGEDRPESSIRIKMSVKDTGIGIRPEDMEKLFTEYERFDEKRNRKIEGTGLGLSITTDLLEMMGSRMMVESTYGEGSEFSFEIMQGVVDMTPVGKVGDRFKNTSGSVKRERFTAEDARILVVDDSSVNLTVVSNLLKRTKINIDTACSGEEALNLVRENDYDVIFLDHLMPGMDGMETLKRMKEMVDNRSVHTPVISLTANADPGARDEYISAGYRDYLYKPINIKELEDMLLRYIPSEKIKKN